MRGRIIKLVLASFIWALISLAITDSDISEIFTLLGTLLGLGSFYGYHGRLILVRLFRKLNLLQVVLGMLIISIIAHLLSAIIIYPGCYILLANQYEPTICVAAKGRIHEMLLVNIFVTLLGTSIGNEYAMKKIYQQSYIQDKMVDD